MAYNASRLTAVPFDVVWCRLTTAEAEAYLIASDLLVDESLTAVGHAGEFRADGVLMYHWYTGDGSGIYYDKTASGADPFANSPYQYESYTETNWNQLALGAQADVRRIRGMNLVKMPHRIYAEAEAEFGSTASSRRAFLTKCGCDDLRVDALSQVAAQTTAGGTGIPLRLCCNGLSLNVSEASITNVTYLNPFGVSDITSTLGAVGWGTAAEGTPRSPGAVQSGQTVANCLDGHKAVEDFLYPSRMRELGITVNGSTPWATAFFDIDFDTDDLKKTTWLHDLGDVYSNVLPPDASTTPLYRDPYVTIAVAGFGTGSEFQRGIRERLRRHYGRASYVGTVTNGNWFDRVAAQRPDLMFMGFEAPLLFADMSTELGENAFGHHETNYGGSIGAHRLACPLGGTIEAGDKFTLEINGVSATISASSSSASTTAQEIAAACAASAAPFDEFSWTTATVGATTFVLGSPTSASLEWGDYTIEASTTEHDGSASDSQTFRVHTGGLRRQAGYTTSYFGEIFQGLDFWGPDSMSATATFWHAAMQRGGTSLNGRRNSNPHEPLWNEAMHVYIAGILDEQWQGFREAAVEAGITPRAAQYRFAYRSWVAAQQHYREKSSPWGPGAHVGTHQGPEAYGVLRPQWQWDHPLKPISVGPAANDQGGAWISTRGAATGYQAFLSFAAQLNGSARASNVPLIPWTQSDRLPLATISGTLVSGTSKPRFTIGSDFVEVTAASTNHLSVANQMVTAWNAAAAPFTSMVASIRTSGSGFATIVLTPVDYAGSGTRYGFDWFSLGITPSITGGGAFSMGQNDHAQQTAYMREIWLHAGLMSDKTVYFYRQSAENTSDKAYSEYVGWRLCEEVESLAGSGEWIHLPTRPERGKFDSPYWYTTLDCGGRFLTRLVLNPAASAVSWSETTASLGLTFTYNAEPYSLTWPTGRLLVPGTDFGDEYAPAGVWITQSTLATVTQLRAGPRSRQPTPQPPRGGGPRPRARYRKYVPIPHKEIPL